MLSGIMLIFVTMFAVIGAYYLSDLLTAFLFRSKRQANVAVLMAGDRMEDVWNGVLDLRARLPQSTVVVLCKSLPADTQHLEPSMQNVLFATPETVGEVVCQQLVVSQKG